MKFRLRLLTALIFAITLPLSVSGQDKAIAKNMCYKFGGEINNDKTPVTIKNGFSREAHTCIVNKVDSLSVYQRAKNLISENTEWKILIGRDWRISTKNGTEYRFINLEVSRKVFVVFIIPVEASDQFYIIAVNNN